MGAFPGLLARAVGNWILIERLATHSDLPGSSELGLLPALLESTMHKNMKHQGALAHPSADVCPSTSSALEKLKSRQLQLFQQCASVAHRPPVAVLRHPSVGRSIAFCLDTFGRMAATISGGKHLRSDAAATYIVLLMISPLLSKEAVPRDLSMTLLKSCD